MDTVSVNLVTSLWIVESDNLTHLYVYHVIGDFSKLPPDVLNVSHLKLTTRFQ